MEISNWFKGFEKGIARLSPEERSAFFSECGKNCVNGGTLSVYKKLYEDAKGNMDVFFQMANDLPGVKGEIVEKGRVYRLIFLECTCELCKKGYVTTPLLCECSRQSVIYSLHSLWKDKRFTVTLCHSILGGGTDCEMRIEVDISMTLRPFTIDDAPIILSWIKDKTAFRKWSADRYPVYPPKPEDMVAQYESDVIFPFTAIDDEGKVVGHIMLRYPDPSKTVIRLGFVIVDDQLRGKGYGKQMLQLAIQKAKEEFGAKKITLGVFDNNPSAFHCYESVGFIVTGSDTYLIDGEEWMGIEMEILDRISVDNKQKMETERILLRPWLESDAETLFKYASDPEVGPRAGWPPHKSVEESLEIIRTVFNAEGMWAVIWKESGEPMEQREQSDACISSAESRQRSTEGQPIGCVGYLPATASNLKIAEDQAEVGYWIARPFWGKGICTEALQMVIDYCFNEKGFTVLWGDYFPSNPASGRVMEKCGFVDTGEETLCPNLEVGSDRPVKVMKLIRVI